ADGASCTGTIGPCTYGDHPLVECRTSAGCGNGAWTVTPPPTACTELAPGCPSSVPNGGACTAPQTTRGVHRTISRGCATCCNELGCNVVCGSEPQGSKVWGCAPALSGNEFCPGVIPNRGAPCEAPSGTACRTDSCGLNVTCENGAWKWE